jgi:SAM-dependent methyltransferase
VLALPRRFQDNINLARGPDRRADKSETLPAEGVLPMGLGYHFVEALIRERAYRPISGNVVIIGRQSVYFSPNGILRLLRENNVDVSGITEKEIELDRATLNQQEAFAGENLISDAALFRLLGVPKVIALDHSDYEGAEIIHDLTKPIPSTLYNYADFIVDGSTLDNVFDPGTTIRNFSEMLRPGGRLITTNIYSNHYEPYVIIPPLWYFDYFVMNGFADCKVYILTLPEPLKLETVNVFTLNLEHLLNPKKAISAFTSPHMMATIVVAEKGDRSTSSVTPSQQHYRSQLEWDKYRQFLSVISEHPRPHLVRSLGAINAKEVKGGHLFMARDFTPRDPAGEMKRVLDLPAQSPPSLHQRLVQLFRC